MGVYQGKTRSEYECEAAAEALVAAAEAFRKMTGPEPVVKDMLEMGS